MRFCGPMRTTHGETSMARSYAGHPTGERMATPYPGSRAPDRLSQTLGRRLLTAGLALLTLTSTAKAQQAIDQVYTNEIREYTTEPFFLTPLVDHLPASNTVPTPRDHLGYTVGKPEQLTYPEEVYSYMRAVEAATNRRSEEHTLNSSHVASSYAVFCWNKKRQAA